MSSRLGRPYSYPKTFCKFLSTVRECSCMDLAMPHPTMTCTNKAVSEIYLFSPIRGYKQCKNTDKELHKAATAVLRPGCYSLGWSQCAHTFLSCHDSTLPGAQPGQGVWVFYQKALGWGCSIAELLQRNCSNTTVPQV